MSKSLQEFHTNIDMQNNVQSYLIDFLIKIAVEKVFNKEDVSSIAEAKEVIDLAFENLDILFPPIVKEKKIINEAR